jgi:hypothetical protein
MDMFSSYDKNLELACIPMNKNGEVKKVNDRVKYIERQYVKIIQTVVPNELKSLGYQATRPAFKFYVLKSHANKLKEATIKSINVTDYSKMNSDNEPTSNKKFIEMNKLQKLVNVDFELSMPDGKTYRNVGNNLACYHDKLFFLMEPSMTSNTGGKLFKNKSRKSKKSRKSRKSKKSRRRSTRRRM